ncbi:MAG: phosphatase PAP2 family protein [Candidatus Cloacimonetes bacterium]|nr:phosphatase PAP2 family protein [Candidatus Cloacimonadota bacterium]
MSSSHILIPSAMMAISAILFAIFDWDVDVQTFYYRDGWYMNESGWLKLIYHYGNIPALIVSIAALFFFFRSFKTSSIHTKYRKLYLFMVLSIILGPGLIVNSALKDNWGRPRPRDLEIFGGRYNYEAPLQIDKSTPGKSFPCGHATMGFYFFATALVCGLWKRRYYVMVNLFALFYGSIIGWVRLMQGGHFLSDVIFSGAIVYVSTHGLWRVMKLDIQPYYIVGQKRIVLRKWHKVFIAAVGAMIIFAVMLATPYNKSKTIKFDETDHAFVEYRLQKANVSVSFSDSTHIFTQASGFGFPGSKIKLVKRETADSLYITQSLKGLFTELNNELKIVVDSTAIELFTLVLVEGMVEISADPHIMNKMDTEMTPEAVWKGDKRFRIRAPQILFTTD